MESKKLFTKGGVLIGVGSALIVLIVLVCAAFNSGKSGAMAYSFIVAGHAYGSHSGSNKGIYPKFYKAVKEYLKKTGHDTKFIILVGDSIRNGADPEAWLQLEKELEELNIKSYLVMGNHDYVSHENYNKITKKIFAEKHGNSYYSFDVGTERFIVLNCMLHRGSIVGEQLAFLKQELEKDIKDIKNIFVLNHELIWTYKKDEYKKVCHNYQSYNNIFGDSNFWTEIFPLFKQRWNKKIYFISGDLGNACAVPAVYEKKANVTFLATGMGEVRDENFMVVNIKKRKASFKLIPLNKGVQLKNIKKYNYSIK